jgi:hypothetical protein
MRFKDIILKHQEICNELYALYLEENKLLQKNQQISDYSILERKKSLLVQLDKNLTLIQTTEKLEKRDPSSRDVLDKTKSRILQILQLDRENEQLILKLSITKGPDKPEEQINTTLLKRIYSRQN